MKLAFLGCNLQVPFLRFVEDVSYILYVSVQGPCGANLDVIKICYDCLVKKISQNIIDEFSTCC